ncbi:MAG TPA: MBL fold metallo-hydrolase, partial [Pyrinomonadaceae bacterium]|nr:MBL fold metallo-hydrolase [Pyrinomonadaceae bacterium]
MKKILTVIFSILALIIVVIAIFILREETDKAVVEKYVRNETLPTVKADWQGTPVDQKGRFVNVEHPFLPSLIDLLKWRLSGNPQKEEKENDRQRLEVLDPTQFLQSEAGGILWLGHAAFYIRLNGVGLLLDPVFGKPSFINPYIDLPSPLDKISRVDYVLISHDHRDHLDEESIRQIAQKFPNAEFLVGLRTDELLKDWITDSNRVQTAGWYQQFSLP